MAVEARCSSNHGGSEPLPCFFLPALGGRFEALLDRESCLGVITYKQQQQQKQ